MLMLISIFPDQHTAPQLQAAKADLEKAKITDILSHKLESRPEKDELVQQNILKGEFMHVFGEGLYSMSYECTLSMDRIQIGTGTSGCGIGFASCSIGNHLGQGIERSSLQGWFGPTEHYEKSVPSFYSAFVLNLLMPMFILIAGEPNLQAKTEALKKAQLTDQLDKKLASRPDVDSDQHLKKMLV